MAEAVYIITNSSHAPEFFQQIALPQKTLTDKGLTGWNITIRLNPPTAANYPAAFPDAAADFFK